MRDVRKVVIGHHVDTVDNWGARGLDPRRAEHQGEVGHHAGLVRAAVTASSAFASIKSIRGLRAPRSASTSYPLALSPPLPVAQLGLSQRPRPVEQGIIFTRTRRRRRHLQGQAGPTPRCTWSPTFAAVEARGAKPSPGLDPGGDQHPSPTPPGRPAGPSSTKPPTRCATSSTAGRKRDRPDQERPAGLLRPRRQGLEARRDTFPACSPG